MSTLSILAAIFAAIFALTHLFIARLHFLDVIPRSRLLSFAGGVAVAYVFLHILPELAGRQQAFADALGISRRGAGNWVYFVALVGLSTFYGLELAVKRSRRRSQVKGGRRTAGPGIFRVHIGSFGLYNVLVGYLLLHREEAGVWPLAIYATAMLLHFVTTDFALRKDHQERYDRSGRWIIAGSVILGWALGVVSTLPEMVIGLSFAFLAGGVVLNVLKEELPEDRKSRLWPFALGAACYASLLLIA